MACGTTAATRDREDDMAPAPAALPAAGERTFHRLLLNSLLSGVTSSFLW